MPKGLMQTRTKAPRRLRKARHLEVLWTLNAVRALETQNAVGPEDQTTDSLQYVRIMLSNDLGESPLPT